MITKFRLLVCDDGHAQPEKKATTPDGLLAPLEQQLTGGLPATLGKDRVDVLVAKLAVLAEGSDPSQRKQVLRLFPRENG